MTPLWLMLDVTDKKGRVKSTNEFKKTMYQSEK
jgi:hypothetical protein